VTHCGQTDVLTVDGNSATYQGPIKSDNGGEVEASITIARPSKLARSGARRLSGTEWLAK